MTRYDLGPTNAIDNVNQFRRPLPVCESRGRTLKIRIKEVARGRYEVVAFGLDLPMGGRFPFAYLDADPEMVKGWIDDLHQTWSTQVIEWQDPATEGPEANYRRPFTDAVDLSDVAGTAVERMWHAVAAAGYQLFWQLFHNGGPALQALGEEVRTALWRREQVVTFTSNDLVAPWSMLYVPRDGWHAPELGNVDPEAFLGFRHLVEHRFEREYDLDADIRFTGKRINASAYYDERLDGPGRGDTPTAVAAPVVATLARLSSTHKATTRQTVGDHLTGDGAAAHLVYFCCHCVPSLNGEAYLRLPGDEDEGLISAGDLGFWIGKAGGLRSSPLVLLNACQSGRLITASASQLGAVLLQRGAGCLLAPCVNIPARFAAAFAEDLFARILPAGRPLGPAVRSAVRAFAGEKRNPLGLTYSLYQGIDSHFCQMENPDGLAAAGR
ncbi:CHAT domain-containing protein [Dactylosporangium sp. NPDC048998]|uniref:CHAT domain-containing protein n=1 Tax=Dactylosporangium sp. NPDC048998 TaxID=3363976 RepID=UPI00371BBCE9